MLAWVAMSVEDSNLERQSPAAGLLYRLTVAFPSWAGAILAVYSLFLCKFGAAKIRLK
jgi:hypothetical protein